MSGLAPAAASGPIVILVAFDGWRWDYLDTLDAPALAAMAARGVRADGLIPVHPSLTFPNHYTLVTGLRPARHGIVSNTMRRSGSARAVHAVEHRGHQQSRLVERRTHLAHGHPAGVEERDDVLAGLGCGDRRTLPHLLAPVRRRACRRRGAPTRCWSGCACRRPSGRVCSTVYYSDLDTAGHDSGPDSPEVTGRGGARGPRTGTPRQRRRDAGTAGAGALGRGERSRHGPALGRARHRAGRPGRRVRRGGRRDRIDAHAQPEGRRRWPGSMRRFADDTPTFGCSVRAICRRTTGWPDTRGYRPSSGWRTKAGR